MSIGIGKPPLGTRITVFSAQDSPKIIPTKNPDLTKVTHQLQYQDIYGRNMVEGEFDTGKRSYGLNRIMAHISETFFSVIGAAFLA